jgi:NIMA (never in mitosis gene a)-related kinase
MIGTPYYLSPEIIQGKPYNGKTDIWSLGAVLYELCALKPPFDAKNIKELGSRIVKGQYTPLPSKFSKEMNGLIAMLMQVDANKRPSIAQILGMEFVKQKINNFLSKTIKLQEFSHTILHNQILVKKHEDLESLK